MHRVFLIFLSFWLVGFAAAQDVKSYIPPRAFDLLPLVESETIRLMPDTPSIGYFGALIEHESCLSLKHSRCWLSTSELKTAREQGAGLGQLTRTWRADGSLRFDSLQEMKDRYNSELKELSWLNIKQKPELQIRAIVLMTRDNYKKLYVVKDPFARLAMADAAYNGGYGGLNKERMKCGLMAGCDPQYWFDHVEKQCLKSTKALYGQRSACDINRNHVKDVVITRLPKYERHFSKKGP